MTPLQEAAKRHDAMRAWEEKDRAVKAFSEMRDQAKAELVRIVEGMSEAGIQLIAQDIGITGTIEQLRAMLQDPNLSFPEEAKEAEAGQ